MVQWQAWCFAVLFALAPQAWADHHNPVSKQTAGDAKNWLQRMVQASKSVSYKGHSVLMSGGELTSLSIYHAPINGEVWERIVHMSGQPAEIIRKGNDVVCLHQQGATRLAPVGPLMAFKKGFEGTEQYYHFRQKARERMAGRSAVRIDVQAKDEHRYGYSLWLDEETGILLKSLTHGDGPNPLEAFEFVQLDVGASLSEQDFQPAPGLNHGAQKAVSGSTQANPTLGWELSWLPQGFKQVKSFMQPQGKVTYSAKVFSDGLAAFTVFYDNGAASQSIRFRGATVAVNHNAGGGSVTVVGEIPLTTAQKVAQSLTVQANP